MKNIISTSRVLAAVSFGIALFAITDAVVAQQNEPASTAQRAQETQAPRIPGGSHLRFSLCSGDWALWSEWRPHQGQGNQLNHASGGWRLLHNRHG